MLKNNDRKKKMTNDGSLSSAYYMPDAAFISAYVHASQAVSSEMASKSSPCPSNY